MSSYMEKLGGLLGFGKTKTKTKNKNNENPRVQQIEHLKEELVRAGYQPAEAEYFIKTAIGSADINKLDNTQLDCLIEKVKAQLKIAQKCKDMIR